MKKSTLAWFTNLMKFLPLVVMVMVAAEDTVIVLKTGLDFLLWLGIHVMAGYWIKEYLDNKLLANLDRSLALYTSTKEQEIKELESKIKELSNKLYPKE